MKIKSNKGFTLIELSIVMALIAIIVSMVCVFIVSYQSRVNNIHNDKSNMQEISEARSAINSWVDRYDSGYYDMYVGTAASDAENGKNKNILSASASTTAKERKLTINSGSLVFKNNELLIDGASTAETKFTTITGMEFQVLNGLVICTVESKNNDPQKLAFALFSKTNRERLSSNQKIDIAKMESTVSEWLTEYMKNKSAQFYIDSDGNLCVQGIGSKGTLSYNASKSQLVWDRNLIGAERTYFILDTYDSIKFSLVGTTSKVLGKTVYTNITAVKYTMTRNGVTTERTINVSEL